MLIADKTPWKISRQHRLPRSNIAIPSAVLPPPGAIINGLHMRAIFINYNIR